MATLSTNYLGLQLDNPLIVGASALTLNANAVGKCVKAGAGAVVLKSLFEEQTRLDSANLNDSLAAEENWHSEVFAYMEADIGMQYGNRDYLKVIRDCKREVGVPIIASLNCVSTRWWTDYASEVEAAGADALELNIAIMPQDLTSSSALIEDQYTEIVTLARQAVSIPIAVKLGPYITSLPQLVIRLRDAGANGFVLFNRFYRPTIDVDKLELTVADQYSTPSELSVPLRWISLLAGRIDADLAAATGVHTADDIARMLLAGADAVQVVSALYLNGADYLRALLDDTVAWMEQKGFASLDDFRGKLSQANNPDNDMFGRCQYIKGLVGIE